MPQFTAISVAHIARVLGVTLPDPSVAQGHEDNIAHLLRPILEALGYGWTNECQT